VLHVFEQACDLISDQEEILSLVTQAIGNGPFSLVLPGLDFRNFIDADSAIHMEGAKLNVGDLEVSTDQATDWNPRPAWDKLRMVKRSTDAHAPTLLQVLASASPPGSLAALVLPQPKQDSVLSTLTLKNAHRAAKPLVNGLLHGDRDTCLKAVESLAGLGGGLTPQGDDFLLGCFIAVWAGLTPKSSLHMLEEIADHAAMRTTPLSSAWIRAAATGSCGEPWHDLFAAVLADQETLVRSAADRLVSIGHTSGADALAGFLSVLITTQG
jgi:hypothetical protein